MTTLVVCEQCGQPHRWRPASRRDIAHCIRCEAVIGRGHRLSVASVLALTAAAAAVWLVAVSMPMLSLSLRGGSETATLPQTIVAAWLDGQPLVAIVSAVTALIAPALFIALRLYVLAPLAAGWRPPGFAGCVRVLHQARRWNMVEVFTVGVLLSLVRLSGLADTSPGPGLYALGALTILFAAIESAGLKHLWWHGMNAVRADAERGGLLGCESCGLVAVELQSDDPEAPVQRCQRCGHVLLAQKPHAVQRTWACVVAAAVLYVPANVLPIMVTTNALQHQEHTLLGGIHELWVDGSWMLSIIVFIASIAVPVLKIGVLGLLAWSVRRAPGWRRLERARLYRLIETVGHWSMLDVFVVVLLAATVRFGQLASVEAGPALLSFAAVVLLTLFATWSFDPRLIWRGADARPGPAEALP